eukprot:scaffold113506_cov33-Tisochrysis_lutea.AAC.1
MLDGGARKFTHNKLKCCARSARSPPIPYTRAWARRRRQPIVKTPQDCAQRTEGWAGSAHNGRRAHG